MIGFHRRWFRFLKHHVWGDAKPKPIVKKVKVEILRIESSTMGYASIVCKINGTEMRVPMTSRDKNPKEAVEWWLDHLLRMRRESQEVQRKVKGWKGEKFEVAILKEEL